MGTTKTKWVIDPSHSEILFKVKHLVISTVSGKFDVFSGEVMADGDSFTGAEISFTAKVDSINTGVADRDGHLKSPDFFDAAGHPDLTFVSKSFKSKGDDNFSLTGDLTIRGITKSVELLAEYGGTTKDPWGNIKAGFEISGKINRKEFGLTWNAATETGGLVVSEEVKLVLAVELLKQA